MRLSILPLAAFALTAQTIPLDWAAAMNRIRADSMRGNLSFLASDLLEGRATPSRGLDIAAEFIAAQFRRAGLEPGGNDGYFHNSQWGVPVPNRSNFSGRLRIGRETILLDSVNAFPIMSRPADLKNIPLLYVESDLKDVEGRAILIKAQNLASVSQKLTAAKPALIVVIDPEGRSLFNRIRALRPHAASAKPVLPALDWLYIARDIEGSLGNAEISLKAEAVEDRPFTMKNVVGILRGSDPVLKDTYLFVTAHYDHEGMIPAGRGDRIFNGANDDGSGTAAVLELAESLSKLPHRPRRSIVFMTVAGEERGLQGSLAYLRAPTVPLTKIVADLNIEVLGRTDIDGSNIKSRITATGFDFTDLTDVLVQAGKETAVEVYRNENSGDAYFRASDNYSFAERGIPSHTIAAGFVYDDYHQVSDHWEKIDYDNM